MSLLDDVSTALGQLLAQSIVRFQLRRGSAADWTDVNPVLADGEPGRESDTGREKRGDGVTPWNELAYTFPIPDETGVPVLFHDFTKDDDQPVTTGFLLDSGHHLTLTGQSGAVVLDGALCVDPANMVSAYYATADLLEYISDLDLSWVRIAIDYYWKDGLPTNLGSGGGGATAITNHIHDSVGGVGPLHTMLHPTFHSDRWSVDTSDNFGHGGEGVYTRAHAGAGLGGPATRVISATLVNGSTRITAGAGDKFQQTATPLGVTGDGIVGTVPFIDASVNTTLTYIDDTHAQLSNAALKDGVVLLTVAIAPQVTDGSIEYHREIIADSKTGKVTVIDPMHHQPITFEITKRVDTATITSGSPVVENTNITSDDIDREVLPDPANGIPAGCYVGSIIPLTSFRLSSTFSAVGQTDVPATGNGTQVTIGNDLDHYAAQRYIFFEGTYGTPANPPTICFRKIQVYTRNAKAQPGIIERAARALGETLYVRRWSNYHIRLGDVATSLGRLTGIMFGPDELVGIARYGVSKQLRVFGQLTPDSYGTNSLPITSNHTIDPINDPGNLHVNGTNLVLTLPTANGSGLRDYRILNVGTVSCTVKIPSSDTGTMFRNTNTSTITIPPGASVTIWGNGSDSWWYTSTSVGDGAFTFPDSSFFQNGWTSDSLSPIGYRRLLNNRVAIIGKAVTGSTGTVAFTMPTAYRPKRKSQISVVSGRGGFVAQGSIDTNGAVTLWDTGAGAGVASVWVSDDYDLL